MKRKRYPEEQIAFALHQAESGTTVVKVPRKMGILNRPSTAGRRITQGWMTIW